MAPLIQTVLLILLLSLVVALIYSGVVAYRGRALPRRLAAHLGIGPTDPARFVPHAFPTVFLVDYLRALATVVARRGLTRETLGVAPAPGVPIVTGNEPRLLALYSGAIQACVGLPQQLRLAIGPEEREEYPTGAVELLSGGEHPVLMRFWISAHEWQPSALDVGCADTPAAVRFATALFQEIDAEARAASVFRRRMIRPYFVTGPHPSRIDIDQVTGEDAPCLPASIRRELEETYLHFKKDPARLEELGVPAQRGLLLCGPPGTGKTSTCRCLHRALPDHTFVSVPLASVDSLEQVFAVARRLAPSVVVLDDVDLYANERKESFTGALLGSLMAQMDGLTSRDDVDVVMTSNSWAGIERALALRPGRIDAVILFENPDAEQRAALLERFLADVELRVGLDELVALTDGFTHAQVRELTKRALAAASARDRASPVSPRRNDFVHAAGRMRANPLLDRTRATTALKRRTDNIFRLEPGLTEPDPPTAAGP